MAAAIPDARPASSGSPPLLKPGKAYLICLIPRPLRGRCLEVDDAHARHKAENPVILSSRKAVAEGACQAFYADAAGPGDCFLLRAKCCADSDPPTAAYLASAPGSGELVVSSSQYRWRLASVGGGFTMAPAEEASRRLRISAEGSARPALVTAVGEPNREHIFVFEQHGAKFR